MDIPFELEEIDKAGYCLYTVIIANKECSVAGTFKSVSGRLVGEWSAHPVKYKTAITKLKAERFLISQDIPKLLSRLA